MVDTVEDEGHEATAGLLSRPWRVGQEEQQRASGGREQRGVDAPERDPEHCGEGRRLAHGPAPPQA